MFRYYKSNIKDNDMRSVNRGRVIKPGYIDPNFDIAGIEPIALTEQGIRNLLYEGYAKECKYCGNTFKSSSGKDRKSVV